MQTWTREKTQWERQMSRVVAGHLPVPAHTSSADDSHRENLRKNSSSSWQNFMIQSSIQKFQEPDTLIKSQYLEVALARRSKTI
jgi:hypothetical protein